MSDALYHEALLALAKAATRAGKLAAPDARVTLDNPLCGDRVTIDVRLNGDVVADLAHEVRGCILCQAAAAAIGAEAVGKTTGALALAEAELRAMLQADGPPPWKPLEPFMPVRAHKSRHECVLLPFETLQAALDQARKPK